MRAFRKYRCDFGHTWTVIVEEGDPELPEHIRCKEDGHEAVTCSEELPSHEVQILIRPAARIINAANVRVRLDGRYYLVLLDRSGQELCISENHHSWDDAVRIGSVFRGKDVERAVAWWSRMKSL